MAAMPVRFFLLDSSSFVGLSFVAMSGKKKTHCKRGHKLIRKNLYIRKDGTRECKLCSLARGRR